jgi:hypothetical protein
MGGEKIEETLADGAAFHIGNQAGGVDATDNKALYPLKFLAYRQEWHNMEADTVTAAVREWIEKAVIGLNLCPFAKAVYVRDQVRIVVSSARHLDGFLEDLDRELVFLAEADPEVVDTTLLVHPALLPDFLDFNDFLQLAELAVEEHALDGTIQVAAFHPHWQFEGTLPDDPGNYSNRAPYPVLHLLREASIDRAVAAFPEAERIYQRNIDTLRALGVAGWRALWVKPGG